MNPQLISDFFLWGMVFIFSTTFHEAAHAWAAKLGGDPTAYHEGQVSLDPMPHIKRSPFGMVLVPIITFFYMGGGWMIGWASAPYDPIWAGRHPRRASLMALAGPASNLLLALIVLVLMWIGQSQGWIYLDNRWLSGAGGLVESDAARTLGNLFTYMYVLNLVLFVFNLIPLPPLDGAQGILILFDESKAREVQGKIESIGFYGLIIAFVFFPLIWERVWPICGNWVFLFR